MVHIPSAKKELYNWIQLTGRSGYQGVNGFGEDVGKFEEERGMGQWREEVRGPTNIPSAIRQSHGPSQNLSEFLRDIAT